MGVTAMAATISGAGATFPFPIYSKWAAAYRSATGNALNYQSIGSGGGIKQIQSKTVTFGATDMPLSTAELNRSGLVQFPTVIGGVVPVINLRGIAPGSVVLDGPTLADDLSRHGRQLERSGDQETEPAGEPAQSADHHGASFGRVRARHSSSPTISARSAPSGRNAREAPSPSTGRSGSAPRAMKASPAMWPRPPAPSAMSNSPMPSRTGSAHTRMINRDGKTVSPVATSFAAAASGANWDQANGFGTILTDQAGAEAWPIAGATFILVHKQPQNAALDRGSAEILPVGVQERRSDGRRARLRGLSRSR